jgi:hypothetical protein
VHSTDPEVIAKQVSIAREYLDSHAPQQQLAEITDIVRKLHDTLTANFSVVEIMPTVKQLLSKSTDS